MEYPLVRACIDLDAIQKNIQNLKQITDKKSKFMAVVKADAYGHGAVQVAKTAVEAGADWLGLARLNKVVEIRQAAIKVPILVFGYIHPSQAAMINDLDLAVTVYDFEMARALSSKAKLLNRPVKVHLKVDTGMGRVGMVIGRNNKSQANKTARKEALKEIEKIIKLPGIDFNGIYTHFAGADCKDRTYTDLQIELFASLLDDLKKKRIEFEICHAANSAGIIEFPESHFDMVRAGISIYGLYPSSEVDRSKVKLAPAMTLTSIVTGVRKVAKGFYVSYGMTHETQKATRLASVPVGYADGFSRRFSSNGFMLVKGHRAPVVGRVCMDQTMIDVGDIPNVKPGDEVVLIGSQGNETIGADELATRINTINYEIVSALTFRVKRIYSDSCSG
ncbi:MAG: alanine racemase [Proteobacteria bacterium]|nr:alanine racemase [Pseudomonadota bacterium]MBU1695799.1 alanine racemase [Pseudomonadota bacterium]